MITVIIGIVVVIVIVCAIAGIYNNMVTKRNRIDNAWQTSIRSCSAATT